MMKNGSQYKKQELGKLTLVDRNGATISHSSEDDETSVEYQMQMSAEGLQDQLLLDKIGQMHQGQLITLVAISLGCAAAAVATGSYAIWMSRRKVVTETLVSVHDLLETCRERVLRMEEELNTASARS